MNREQQEMALWREAYRDSHCFLAQERAAAADAAVAEFRKRYPAEPDAPEPTAPGLTWYDKPPFKKDGGIYYCWVEGSTVPQSIYWSGGSGGWLHFCDRTPVNPLNGRRVSPIIKPPEPTT